MTNKISEDMGMTPEEQAQLLELMRKFAAQTGAAITLPQPVEVKPKFPLGEMPSTLDIESPRMYVRMQPSTEYYFNEATDWLRNSGYLCQGRKPKAQVLFHVLVHEFFKLSEEDRRKMVEPYMD